MTAKIKKNNNKKKERMNEIITFEKIHSNFNKYILIL